MDKSIVYKVTAVVLRGEAERQEVLVFDHPLEEGGFNVQLPAGTIEPSEAPEAAVLRELREETGIAATLESLAGVIDEEWEGQYRRRWIYILSAYADMQKEWPFHCDCGALIRCYWLPLSEAQIMEHQQRWLDVAKAYALS